MKRKVHLGLEVSFLLGLMTLSGTTLANSWSYGSYIDSMTDVPISYATLKSPSRSHSPMGYQSPEINVICNGGNIQVQFVDPDTILFDQYPVTYRFDSTPAVDERWYTGPGQDNLYTRDPLTFVEKIQNSSQLLYQVIDVLEERYRYRFNIPHNQSNLHQVLADCGIIDTPPPSSRPYNEDLDLSLESNRYIIRLSSMENGKFKYQSWPIDTGNTGSPDLELTNGSVVNDGTGGNHRYVFTNGNYSYIIHANLLTEPGHPTWELEVKQGDETLLRDPLQRH